MSRRERELITALAEGRLEDETEARALIEKSSRLRRQYEEQRRALEALASIRSESLTEAEKTDLRRDVWTALTTTPSEPVKASGRWVWGYAAVFVFAAVGLVAVLNNSFLDEGSPTFGGSESQSDGVTGAPSETPEAPGAERARLFSSVIEQARSDTLQYLSATNGSVADAAVEWDRCAKEVDVEEYELLGTIEELATRFAVARAIDTDTDVGLGEEYVEEYVVVDLETCAIAYQDD